MSAGQLALALEAAEAVYRTSAFDALRGSWAESCRVWAGGSRAAIVASMTGAVTIG